MLVNSKMFCIFALQNKLNKIFKQNYYGIF